MSWQKFCERAQRENRIHRMGSVRPCGSAEIFLVSSECERRLLIWRLDRFAHAENVRNPPLCVDDQFLLKFLRKAEILFLAAELLHSLRYFFATAKDEKSLGFTQIILAISARKIARLRAEDVVDLSRFSAAPSSHLSGYPFESQGAFPA